MKRAAGPLQSRHGGFRESGRRVLAGVRDEKAALARGAGMLARFVTVDIETATQARQELSAAGITDIDKAFALTGKTVTAHARRSARKVELGGKGYYLKLVGAAGPKQVAEALLALKWPMSKCRREWIFAKALAGVGVAAAPLAAFGEARLGIWPLKSFLIAGEIPGSEPLDEFLARAAGADGGDARRMLRALARELAGVIARMHNAGLYHRDLYAKHIFVRPEGGGFAINIIDLQRMARGGGLKRAVKDLACLNVTIGWRIGGAAERLRFLAEYSRQRWPGGKVKAAALARRVLARSAAISRRSKLRGTKWRRGEGK